MKIAVTSTGNDLDSPVDERFGRAAYFIIFNTDDESFEAVDNSANVAASHGAGGQAAQTIADKGVEWLLTGHVGPRAYATINSAGIKISSGASGTVREVLKRFKDGEFTPSSGSDVGGHW